VQVAGTRWGRGLHERLPVELRDQRLAGDRIAADRDRPAVDELEISPTAQMSLAGRTTSCAISN
jgi:hypothetical protein